MKRLIVMSLFAVVCVVSALPASAAAKVKTYQVTGPVVELTDTKIVIQTKDDGNWEIARDAALTKVTGELKVGAKVTVEYRMTAATIEVKPSKDALVVAGADAAKPVAAAADSKPAKK
jgi:RNase P/RNase MRP subunit p29